MFRSAIGAVLLAALLIASLLVVGPTTLAAEQANRGPTEIEACTTIDTSGHYELASDVDATNLSREGFGEAGAEPCITITASDVVLDGDGHAIQGRVLAVSDSTIRFVPVGIAAPADAAASNVTVRNVAVDTARTEFSGIDGLTLSNVDVTAGSGGEQVGIRIQSSSDASVTDTNVSGYVVGLGVSDSRNVRIANGTFDGIGPGVSLVVSENVALANSTLQGDVEIHNSNDVDVVNNEAANEFVDVEIRSRNVLVANNNLAHVAVAPPLGYLSQDAVRKGPVVVRDNVLQSPEVGPYVNPGDTVAVRASVDASPIEIHGNVLNATRYGVRNEGEGLVDARGNYWGHPSGPSSPEIDGNRTPSALADPRTGALADGEGSMVSADPEKPATSNVCFDPPKETAETGTEVALESE